MGHDRDLPFPLSDMGSIWAMLRSNMIELRFPWLMAEWEDELIGITVNCWG